MPRLFQGALEPVERGMSEIGDRRIERRSADGLLRTHKTDCAIDESLGFRGHPETVDPAAVVLEVLGHGEIRKPFLKTQTLWELADLEDVLIGLPTGRGLVVAEDVPEEPAVLRGKLEVQVTSDIHVAPDRRLRVPAGTNRVGRNEVSIEAERLTHKRENLCLPRSGRSLEGWLRLIDNAYV